MKSKKLTLHKSTVRKLGSESLKTLKGGGLTLPGCVNLLQPPAPKPAAPAPHHHKPYTWKFQTKGTQCNACGAMSGCSDGLYIPSQVIMCTWAACPYGD